MRISVAEPQFVGNELTYVTECVRSRQLTSVAGSFVSRFEEEFAKMVGVRYAVSCMNGTAALHLALLALDVKPGDHVIVPALTYIATANAVRYCGAEPVFVDVDPLSWCMSPQAVESALRTLSSKVVGLLPVHLYGHVAQMDHLRDIAYKHKLWIVEDAAEAHGAQYRNRPVGSIGELATFSFYGNKIITCGEGGMVTTDREHLRDRMVKYRGQGQGSRRYYHDVIGYNYRMTNLQAAIGLAQLETMEWHLARRSAVVQQYQRELQDARVVWQSPRTGTLPVDWMFTVLVPKEVDRDSVMKTMAEEGVETRPAFPLLTEMPMYSDGGLQFPFAQHVSDKGINLPTHAGLTPADVSYVTEQLMKAMEAHHVTN